MSGSATFSYAQAAKGQATNAQSSSLSTTSQTASTTSTQSHDAPATATSSAGVPSASASTTSNEFDTLDNLQNSGGQTDGLNKKQEVEIKPVSNLKAVSTQPETENSAATRRETDSGKADNGQQPVDRKSRPANANLAKAPDSTDGKRPRKGKKGKNAEKEDQDAVKDVEKEKEVPKPELFEAPIPRVNVWDQRKAQAARTKSTPDISKALSDNGADISASSQALPPTNPGELTRAGNNAEVSASQKASHALVGKNQRRAADIMRPLLDHSVRKSTSRGPRSSGRGDDFKSESLPPVGDSVSWPTPETANEEVQRKPQDRTEKEDKEENGPVRPRQKKEWVQMPYVPTVNFQTPLPARGSRGGRTVGRGGRESSTRAAQGLPLSQSTERGQTSINGSKISNNAQDGGSSLRAISGGTGTSKRSSVDGSSRDVRKSLTLGSLEVSKPTTADSFTDITKAEATESGRSTSGYDILETQKLQTRALGADKRNGTNPKGFASFKDGSQQSPRDHAPQNRERGKGNSRGRGSLHGMNGQTGAPHTPYPQVFTMAPTQALRASSMYSPPPQQSPYGTPFGNQTPNGNGRNPRSHSSYPAGSFGRNNVNGSRSHSNRPSMHAGTANYDISAHPMAYAYPNYDVNVMPLVLTQLEYYFSIDNLCKDVFLRKHMDSQGFVFISVIAGFKRMQHLTHDIEVIRAACDESRHVDFVVGEDGLERVRRLEGWQHWILPMEERDESVRYEGPAAFYIPNMARGFPYSGRMMPFATSPSAYSPQTTESHFGNYQNGNHVSHSGNEGTNGTGFPSESQLSAAVPEFSPAGHSGLSNGFDTVVHPTGTDSGASSKGFTTNKSGSSESFNQSYLSQPLVNGFHDASAPVDKLSNEHLKGPLNGIEEGQAEADR